MKIWTVDAFTTVPFRGNPACIVEPFDRWPDSAWMQKLAAENNQSETAYLKRTAAPDRFAIRWFTPTAEAPLCGHATLAAAHVLFHERATGLLGRRIAFESMSGELSAVRLKAGYELDFPIDRPDPIAPPSGLADVLPGIDFEPWSGRQYLCAILPNEEAVRRYRPNLAMLAAIDNSLGYERGSLVIAAYAEPGRPYDVVSRFFAPLFGIPEDPATGSAHCMLAPLFGAKLGQSPLRFHQAYPGRGADLTCELAGARVLIRGSAVTVCDGNLRWSPIKESYAEQTSDLL